MGRKGKRVLEQSTGSSTPAVDFETIRLIPAQKQDTTGTGSSLPFGVSAPPGLDPPESKADSSRPLVGPIAYPLGQKCQYCSCPAADVILHMYFIDANSMSIGSTLAQIFLGFRLEQLGSRRPLIRAVGLSSLAFSN